MNTVDFIYVYKRIDWSNLLYNGIVRIEARVIAIISSWYISQPSNLATWNLATISRIPFVTF